MGGKMRSFGKVSGKIWHSEKLKALKSHAARLVYIWLHTSFENHSGVMRVGPAEMADELSFAIDEVATPRDADRYLDELEEVGLIRRVRPYIIITNFVRFNRVKSFTHAIAAWRDCLSLPDGPEKEELCEVLRGEDGTSALLKWTGKDGKPHEIVREMQDYALALDAAREAVQRPSPHPNGEGHLYPIEEPTHTPSRGPRGGLDTPYRGPRGGLDTPDGGSREGPGRKEKIEYIKEGASRVDGGASAETASQGGGPEVQRKEGVASPSAMNSRLAREARGAK